MQKPKKLNLNETNSKSNLPEIQINRSFTQKLYNTLPSLYIFLNLKNTGLRNAVINLKGYKAIKEKSLFDTEYYLNRNRDIKISGMDPILHYIYHGFKEERNPSSTFDGKYYINRYENVKASGMNPLVHYSLYGMDEGKKPNGIMKISVIVTSYNHEKYIKKCLDSVLMQKGVSLELIIGDDCSTDRTLKILEEYQKQHPQIITLYPSTKNMGVTKNLKRCLKAVTGDYVAICEGDDYWTDPYKLLKQANFLNKRKDCVMCFNSIMMYYEDNTANNYVLQEKLTKETYTTRELILDNFIGNFSCCMYRADIVKKLPDDLYDIFIVDWMFNIVCSEYGKIGFLNENMSVYRIHDNGLWSGKCRPTQFKELYGYIDTYNEFLSFKYDSEFKKYQQRILELEREESKKIDFQDIIILDDVFPHPLSAFRLQEYNSYLEYFDKMKIYCNPVSFPALHETRPLEDIIENYEAEYPQFKGCVEKFDPDINLGAKAVYTIFISNIYRNINIIEKFKLPFVFTLYPGGGFLLNNKISDGNLERVFSSPYFRKVIVTQKIIKNYLIDNKLCEEDQIEEIFGIVTPLKLLEQSFDNKKYYGKDKSSLDICFVAHRYTEKGVDKGYDVFIKVAHELSKKYDNIHFHVVGNFDESIIDISLIKDRIKFYGPQLSEWFNEFYKDKDIILSPNIPFKLKEGSFDGFPTGCCTEAGLHKVAIFCTDELKLNTNKYNDKEIVIIPYDSGKIVEIIEKYYHNPEKLQEISESGYNKIKELYNYNNQIQPRINILKELISDYDEQI